MGSRSTTTRTPALLGGKPVFEDPVYITRALAPDRSHFDVRVAAIFESNRFTNNGPLVRELQERLVAMRPDEPDVLADNMASVSG